MAHFLMFFFVILFLKLIYLNKPNTENKNLKYLKTFKKENNLFIQEKFILKDKNIKTTPNTKSKKFIIK